MIIQKTTRNIIFLIVLIVLSFSCKKDENITIKKEKVSGFAQKGPYINGTQILMSELNTSLQQTGNVFSTQIINNQGSFELNDLTLESQFVEFSASGFYFDEIKGELSSAPLTLYALSDIKDISTVNVNILTHLEKRRVEHLVKNDGKSFSDAKKIAQSEVLAIFGFSNDDMGNSESLDIVGKQEGSAILLAISVILQGQRSVGELSELLAAISDDISNDGILDNETIINDLKESTEHLDFEIIKQNLEERYISLGLNVSIPGFVMPIYFFLNRCWPPPTEAIAGAYRHFNDGTTSTTLAANTPVEGTGKWSIISGEGGSFDDETKPDAVFSGQHCSFYELKWTISTACGNSSSDVFIAFFHESTKANAGADQYFKDVITTSTTLEANTPIEGIGQWSILSGEGGSFDDDSKPNAVFTGKLHQRYELNWFITTECDYSGDGLTVIFGLDGSIASIRSLHHEGSRVTIPGSVKLEGIVISDKDAENIFGRNLHIIDENDGTGILLRFAYNHNFPMGARIRVDVSGIELSRFNGLLQVNNIPNNQAEQIGMASIPAPEETTIANILENMAHFESRLVKLTGVTVSGGKNWGGSRTLSDGSGTITHFTTNFSKFANTAIQSGQVNLTGIVTVFNSPQISIRNLTDVE